MYIYLFKLEVDGDEHEPLLANSLKLLSASEQIRSDRIIQPRVKLRFIISRVLLRKCLSLHLDMAPEDIPITKGHDGKPELCLGSIIDKNKSGGLVSFNLSHSQNMIAIAISREGDIGIDIERIRLRRNLDKIAESYFSELENKQLASIDLSKHPRMFYSYWTLKEAYTKALGLGFRKAFNSFGFELSEPVQVYEDGEKKKNFSFLQFLILDKYQMAVCLKRRGTVEHEFYSMSIDLCDDSRSFLPSLDRMRGSQKLSDQSWLIESI